MSLDSSRLRGNSVPASPRHPSLPLLSRGNSVPYSPRNANIGCDIYHDADTLVNLHVNAKDAKHAAMVDILVAEKMSSVMALRYGTALVEQRVATFDAAAFAQTVVDLGGSLQGDSLKARKGLILSAVVIEAEACDVLSNSHSPFREETFACRVVKACMLSEGAEELSELKRACFDALSKALKKKLVKNLDLNSLESLMQEDSQGAVDEETVRTYYTVAAVLKAMAKKTDDCPRLTGLFTTLRMGTEMAYTQQNGKALAPAMVSNFLFLRYLCPYLVQLNKDDKWVKKLKGKEKREQFLKYARIVGKLLQYHANGTFWKGEKQVFNENQKHFDKLVDSLSLKVQSEPTAPAVVSNNEN